MLITQINVHANFSRFLAKRYAFIYTQGGEDSLR